jgi:hypothetical protein
MNELKGWSFEPCDGINLYGIGDGLGPGPPG